MILFTIYTLSIVYCLLSRFTYYLLSIVVNEIWKVNFSYSGLKYREGW